MHQKVVVTGTGSHVPDEIITNFDLEKMVDTSDEWIVQRTGIHERRRVAPHEATSDIATASARKALEMAQLPADRVDGLILCSVTPDTFVPAGSCYIHRDLETVNATAFDLTAACTGWAYGVQVAKSMIISGEWEHAIVIGAESLSKILDYEDRNTCILFGDGAGSTVISRADVATVPIPDDSDIIDQVCGTDGVGWDLILQPGGGSRIPATSASVDEKKHFLTMRGREVFKFAVKKMTELVKTCIERNDIELESIDHFVPHQVNIRILEAVFDNLGLSMDKCIVNLDRVGNTSAASVPIAMDEAVREGRIQRGDLVFTTAFGSGLTWGWNLIRY